MSDGRLVAAAQEERFTRKKHDHNFPKNAVDYCLREAKLQPEDLDYVVFYDKPLLKFERLLETYLAFAPQGSALVPDGDAALAENEIASAARNPQIARRPVSGQNRLYRPPRIARGQRVLPVARLTKRRFSRWTASANGTPPASASGAATKSNCSRRWNFRTRSACFTARSPISPASASIPANTNSWASRPTASRNTPT